MAETNAEQPEQHAKPQPLAFTETVAYDDEKLNEEKVSLFYQLRVTDTINIIFPSMKQSKPANQTSTKFQHI
jgi:hypothetical protein